MSVEPEPRWLQWVNRHPILSILLVWAAIFALVALGFVFGVK